MWAIVHRRSFESVTGRKTDYWLVLAGGSAASFALVDVVYVWRRRISPIYLADAALHALLAALALAARLGARGRAQPGAGA